MIHQEAIRTQHVDRNCALVGECTVGPQTAPRETAIRVPVRAHATELVRDELSLVSRIIRPAAHAETIAKAVLEAALVALTIRADLSRAAVELAVAPTADVVRIRTPEQSDTRKSVRVEGRALTVRLPWPEQVELADVVRAVRHQSGVSGISEFGLPSCRRQTHRKKGKQGQQRKVTNGEEQSERMQAAN